MGQKTIFVTQLLELVFSMDNREYVDYIIENFPRFQRASIQKIDLDGHIEFIRFYRFLCMGWLL